MQDPPLIRSSDTFHERSQNDEESVESSPDQDRDGPGLPAFRSPGLDVESAGERMAPSGCPAATKTELRLRSLVDAISQVVWIADERGSVLEVSDRWSEMAGMAPDEFEGSGWVNLVHPEDRAHVVATWHDMLARKAGGDVEFRLRCGDDVYKWFSSRVVPIFDGGGAFVEWVGTLTDIDDRKAAEAALRKSETLYRTMVDTAHEGVWLLDSEARTTFVNASMTRMIGYTAEEMAGRTFIEFVLDEDKPAAVQRFARRKQGISEAYDIRFQRRDGSVRWMLISGSPFVDENGQFAGSLGMLTDITERKEYEQGLIAAKEKAEELARLKSTLLTNLSHEIRTPLTGILGFADVIASLATESDEVLEYADFIAQSGERLMSTLNSVLELAQLESGSLRISSEVFDAAHRVRRLLPALEPVAVRRGLYLRIEQDSSDLFTVGDPAAFARIMTNLISNGLKFTEKGGVSLRLVREQEWVRVDVIDTGIGIDESFRSQLFQDFKQESDGISRAFEGVGLGLSISSRLVKLMGGSIGVSSQPGVGSTFTVRLPAETAASPAPATAHRRSTPAFP